MRRLVGADDERGEMLMLYIDILSGSTWTRQIYLNTTLLLFLYMVSWRPV